MSQIPERDNCHTLLKRYRDGTVVHSKQCCSLMRGPVLLVKSLAFESSNLEREDSSDGNARHQGFLDETGRSPFVEPGGLSG